LKHGGLFSLNDIVKGINNLIELAEKVEAAGGKKAYRGEMEFPGNKDIKAKYNVNVNVGKLAEGIREVDHLISKAKDLTPEDSAEPVLDIFNEEEYVMVVVELPEANEKSLKVEVDGQYLEIKNGNSGNGNIRVELPAEVEPQWKVTVNNGIVEITLPKAGAAGTQ